MKTIVDEVMEMMERRAIADASGDTTGWSYWDDAYVAYYPRSGTFNWFLIERGCVNKRDVAEWFTNETQRSKGDKENVIRIENYR